MTGESCYPTPAPAISTLGSGHPPHTEYWIITGASLASAALTHWNTLPLTRSELRSKKAFAYRNTFRVQWLSYNWITAEKAKMIMLFLPLGLAVLWTQQPFHLCKQWDTSSTQHPFSCQPPSSRVHMAENSQNQLEHFFNPWTTS